MRLVIDEDQRRHDEDGHSHEPGDREDVHVEGGGDQVVATLGPQQDVEGQSVMAPRAVRVGALRGRSSRWWLLLSPVAHCSMNG